MKNGVVIAVAVGIAAATGFFVQRQFSPAPPAAPTEVAEGPQSENYVKVGAGTGGGDAAARTTDTATTGAAVTAEEAAPPKVPESLPHIELADRDGKKRSLKEWSGQPIMVNFWATWCGPCRREIPLLNQLRAQRASQRLEIIGIAVDFRDDVLAYAKQTTISYPLLIGEEDGLAAVKAVGMQPAFPFTIFADSKQRIVALKIGELHQDEADLILDRVLAVDTGKMPLATAREEITAGLKEIAIRRAAKEAKARKTD